MLFGCYLLFGYQYRHLTPGFECNSPPKVFKSSNLDWTQFPQAHIYKYLGKEGIVKTEPARNALARAVVHAVVA
jgi:hypothetical protein